MQEHPLRLLHVEDDATDAYIVNETLSVTANSSGRTLEITHVEDMKSALSAIQSDRFDAVLLDLGLEDISGPICVSAIREEVPDMPVIVLSGNKENETAIESYKNGAHEYLVKGACDGDKMRSAIHDSIYCESLIKRLRLTVESFQR